MLYTIESWCSLDLTMDFHVFIKTCLSVVDVLFITFRISRRILRLFSSLVMCVYREKLLLQTTAKIGTSNKIYPLVHVRSCQNTTSFLLQLLCLEKTINLILALENLKPDLIDQF